MDEQGIASHRAATLNDLLRDAHGDRAAKAEGIAGLERFPHVAAAPVEGTKLTVLEHALTRLTRIRPASQKGETKTASPEHEQHWMDATQLMQQYARLAEGPLAAKLAPALNRAAAESLKGGKFGASLTAGLVKAAHVALGTGRREENAAAVSRSIAQGGDAVHTAEQHVQADLEKLLGGRSQVTRACQDRDVEAYRQKAVAELVLAGAARRADIPVAGNMFARDGDFAHQVRRATNELWGLHSDTAAKRTEHGETAAETFLAQRSDLDRLRRLLPLYENRAVPSPQTLRDHLED